MNDEFKEKIVLVTGASRGIGRTIATNFGKLGSKVMCLATKKENCSSVVDEITSLGGTAFGFGCRVDDSLAVKQTFEEISKDHGPVKILINNAGVSLPTPTLAMTEENWDQHMNINCKSIFLCSQAAGLMMKDHGGGCIVNIGSILGRNAFPAALGYCTTKAAIDQMTKVLAIEWAKYKIRVNCIAPGYVRTDLIDRLAEEGKIKLNDLEKRTPQRRLGSEQEVTDAVIFSCSDRSSFMTGETLVIDGGWTAFGFYN